MVSSAHFSMHSLRKKWKKSDPSLTISPSHIRVTFQNALCEPLDSAGSQRPCACDGRGTVCVASSVCSRYLMAIHAVYPCHNTSDFNLFQSFSIYFMGFTWILLDIT